METINGLLDFLKQVVITTLSQLFWLLGLLFVFGFLLYIFARLTRITYVKSVGQKLDIIVTGWIGTPVHELGHLIFCLLFWHKVTGVKLYSPNAEDRTLGYVNHSYNPNSTYQKIGNFFIGAGPIIFGALVLYAIMYYLMPNSSAIFSGVKVEGSAFIREVRSDIGGFFITLLGAAKTTLGNLLRAENFSNFRFWIFLYLAISISSHMQLSPADIKGAGGGLLALILLFLVVNLIILGIEAIGLSAHFGSWWNYVKLEHYSMSINRCLGNFGALFAFATIISGLNFAVSYILLTIYNLVKGKGLINPVW